MSLGQANDIRLSEAEFNEMAKIASDEYGIHIDTVKLPMLQSRIGRRLGELQLGNFSEYCAFLQKDYQDEKRHFISAITTNVTHFFREDHHFEYFEANVLPNLVERAQKGDPVRIWSAGCSSGQEPYSIAACILKKLPADRLKTFDLKILATDVDENMLSQAETGFYSQDLIANVPPDLHDVLFENAANGKYRVSAAARQMTHFKVLNLKAAWPMRMAMDAIFCRNVAIYFDREMQRELWKRFTSILKENGTLFIGHSERISGQAIDDFEQVGVTTYRRKV